MRHGSLSGEREIARCGAAHSVFDAFIREDGAYTTVAAAVTILVVVSLLFAAVSSAWTAARSQDVQVVADAAAMAGTNVVSSYHTAATVVDASVASLGFAGLAAVGTGLVGMLVPGAHVAAGKSVEAGMRMLSLRNDFARSASRGLNALEKSVPYLVAANATRLCSKSATEHAGYTGTAFAVPTASASFFPALEQDAVDLSALEESAEALDAVAGELEEAAAQTVQAKERAWLADCGREGFNMQERADRLSGISAADNPDFASSIAWMPKVGIERTRAYYAWRMELDEPEGPGTEAAADCAARRAFYRFAFRQFEHANIVEYDGTAALDVPLLPRNTQEVRASGLYSEAVWPTSREADGLVMHYGSSCPGAKGPAGPAISFASMDGGVARLCPVCRFDVGDMGKVPAASTSIDNGYEYHLREFTLALNDYVDSRNRELELERRAQAGAETSASAFERVLGALSSGRPRIAPPGRFGCVSTVLQGGLDAPEAWDNPAFFVSGGLERRAAVSAATLAKDPATRENNVLSRFFSTVRDRSAAGGVAGLAGDVMDLWGDLLVSYSDMGDALSLALDELCGGLDSFGLGPVGSWLRGRLSDVVGALGMEPVDLSLRKPVLTDSSNVIAHADAGALADIQQVLRNIPAGSNDPVAMAQAVGYELGEYVASAEFTIAEIPLPGGGSIPLTVRLRDLMGGGSP